MQKKLLTNGNVFKRKDGRWGGTIWYADESGERKRKCFSGTNKQAVNKKITAYITDFEKQLLDSDESRKTLQESMQHWLEIFKFPSVEQTTYDRAESTAKNQIYPLLNTGLRTCEILGLLNKDIDLENRTMTIRQEVKEISKREGTKSLKGRTIKVGKTKSATSKRMISLNTKTGCRLAWTQHK